MSRRGQSFPDAPQHWDPSSREVWASLVRTLENSYPFDKGRRTRPAFIVEGTVSAPVTLDVNSPDLAALTHIVAKLLVALQDNGTIDVR